MIGNLKALTLAVPVEMAISSWALVALAALWLLLGALWRLPDWCQKWLDVRDRWQR